MKKLLVISCMALISATSGFAQGTVNFANFGTGVDAIILNADAPFGDGAPLAGAAFAADLYYGPAGISDPLDSSLQPLGVAINFATGAGAGYFLGGTQTLPGTTAGNPYTLQVRAWNTAAGATFAEAAASPTGLIGWSGPLQVTLGGGTIPNPNMVGLEGFQLQPVPEPSTLALAGLGIVGLLMMRRKRA